MIILKYALLAILIFFVYAFIKMMLQKDEKFGRFNWQASLASAAMLTGIVVMRGIELVVSAPYRVYTWSKQRAESKKP